MISNKDTAEKFINQFWPTAFYTETRPVERGTLYGFFVADGDRYAFDFGCKKDWYQVDNDQDSWYYGQWSCPANLQTLEYCEGDIYLLQCQDKAAYLDEIKKMGKLDDHNQCHDELLRGEHAI